MKIEENEEFQISRKINVKNKESIRKKRIKLQLFIKILNSFGGDEICQIQSLSLMKIK